MLMNCRFGFGRMPSSSASWAICSGDGVLRDLLREQLLLLGQAGVLLLQAGDLVGAFSQGGADDEQADQGAAEQADEQQDERRPRVTRAGAAQLRAAQLPAG